MICLTELTLSKLSSESFCFKKQKNSSSKNSTFINTKGCGSFYQSQFNVITSFFITQLENSLRNNNLTQNQLIQIYCNVFEWNKKIENYNVKLDALIRKIAGWFCSCSYLDSFCKKVRKNKIPLEPLNQKIWQLETKKHIRVYRPICSISFDNWFSQHSGNFIAHAVHSLNIPSLLKEGELLPSEMLLRKYGTVRHETFMLKYASSSILFPALTLQLIKDDIKTLKIEYDKSIEKLIADEVQKPSYYGKCNYEWNTFITNKLAKYAKWGLCKSTVLFALDNSATDSIDQKLYRLAQGWKKYQSIHQEYPNFLTRIACIRELVLPLWKILPDIRATSNRVDWQYGEVVILKGVKEKSIIGDQHNVSIKNEVSLLYPFQNGGKFLGLPLNNSDTIILGPREVLSRYKSQYSNICYVEELSPHQKKHLEIPTSSKSV